MSDPWGGLWGSWLENSQSVSLVTDCQTSIQVVMQFDPDPSIAVAVGSGWDLQTVTVKGNGIVIGHRAGVLEAEVILRMAFFQSGHESRIGISRFHLEAGVELGQVSCQHLVGAFKIACPGFAQFLDQAVL